MPHGMEPQENVGETERRIPKFSLALHGEGKFYWPDNDYYEGTMKMVNAVDSVSTIGIMVIIMKAIGKMTNATAKWISTAKSGKM